MVCPGVTTLLWVHAKNTAKFAKITIKTPDMQISKISKIRKKIIESAPTNLGDSLYEKNKFFGKLLVFMSGVSPAAEV